MTMRSSHSPGSCPMPRLDRFSVALCWTLLWILLPQFLVLAADDDAESMIVDDEAQAKSSYMQNHNNNNNNNNNLRGLSMVNTNPLQPTPRIINGNEVNEARYPYFSLMYGRSMCGAVLIGPRLVLSAAHCQNAATSVRVGAWEGTSDGTQIGIRNVIVHPEYSDFGYDHDIMIMQLEESVADYPYIQLERAEVTGGSFVVIGFGDTDIGPGLSLSNVLQEVELEYVDNDDCDDGHGGNGDVMEDMLCAAGPQRDSCIGDSGGPLIARGDDVAEDRLVGLVSWGRGCALPGYAGVYARISYFYEWITQMACINFPDDVPAYINCITVLGLETESPTVELSGQAAQQNEGTNVTTSSNSTPPTLEFVAWSPDQPLKMCQGDCDTDADCEGDLVCLTRTGDGPDVQVPGCEDDVELPRSLDFCVNGALLEAQRQGA